MTALREAAQQALEALGLAKLNGKAGLYPAETEEIADAIIALRAALAQQAEPVEPVAWLDGPHLVVRLDMRNRLNYQGPWVDLGRAIPDKWTPFLFTAPAPAQAADGGGD